MHIPFEHTLRTQIRAELATLDRVFTSFSSKDLVSQQVFEWKGKFVEAIAPLEDPKEVVEEYKQKLVAIIGLFAEKVSYLGSDGRVYGEKRLYVSLKEQPSGFTVKRNPTVEALFSWLVSHGVEIVPPVEILEAYEKMREEGPLPELPTDLKRVQRQERMKQIRQERLAREKREQEARETAKKFAEETMGNSAQGGLNEIREKLQRQKEEAKAKREEAQRREAAEEEELLREEADWKARNEQLKQKVVGLEEQERRARAEVERSRQAVDSLEKEIQKTKEAIEAKKSREERTAMNTIAIAVASAAIATTTGVAMYEPTGGQGIMIGATVVL